MIRHVYARNPIYSLLLTFGLAFILQDACRYIWGPNGLPLGIPDILSQPITPDLFFITWYRVFMVAIVIVAVVGLFAFLRYTRVGMRIRAGTLDLDTVSALGVNVRRCAPTTSPSAASSPASPACWPPARSGSTPTWATTCSCRASSPSSSAASAA